MLTEDQKQQLQNNQKDLQRRLSEKEKEKSDLTEENSDLLKSRDLAQESYPKAKKKTILFLSLAFTCACFAFSVLQKTCFTSPTPEEAPTTSIPGIIGAGVLLVAMVVSILLSVAAKRNGAHSLSLLQTITPYDVELEKITLDIRELEQELFVVENELKADSIEGKLEKYKNGYICVFVGQSYSKNGKNPFPSIDRVLHDNTILIDGVETARAVCPFVPIEVTPGTHVVKVKGYDSDPHWEAYLDAPPYQVKMNGPSIFLCYNWHRYFTGDGFYRTVYTHECPDIITFLKESGQFYGIDEHLNKL